MGTTERRGESSVDVFRVAVNSIDYVWPRCKELMELYDGGVFRFTDLDTVYELLKEDKLELWVGIDKTKIELAGLTQVCGTKEKYVELFWIGGENFDRYLERGLEQIQRWGALIGAQNLVIGGRLGWVRKLRGRGFDLHRVELIKPLSHVATDEGDTSWRN